MNIENLESEFKTLMGLRNTDREQKLKQVANSIYSYLKEFNFKTITRNLIESFMSDSVNKRTKDRTTTEILKLLEQQQRIQKTEIIKKGLPFFRTRELKTYDFESYSVLMAKNGYKTHYYIFKQDKEGIPRKKQIGITDINQDTDLTEQADLIQTSSRKSRHRQRCMSESSLSIAKVNNYYPIKVYKVI